MKKGTFTCKVVAPSNGWFGEAGRNNSPFIRLPLIVTQEGPCEGEEVIYQAWITDAAVDRTVKNLAEVFGWDGDLPRLAKLTNTGPFVDKSCQIVCEEEEHEGRTKVVVKWLNAVGSGGKLMEVNRALELANRLAGRAKAAATGAPPPKRATDPDWSAPDADPSF